MKSVGEVMAIGRTFAESLQKALRGLETGLTGLNEIELEGYGKDEDKKQTRSGIHLPDKIEIPTLTGRIICISAQVDNDDDYPIKNYDRVLFNPSDAIPVDFEGDNRLFVVPVENVVAVFRKSK